MANKTSAKDALEGVGGGGAGGGGSSAAMPFVETAILMVIVGIVVVLFWPIWRRRQLRKLYHSNPTGRVNVGRPGAEVRKPEEPTSTEVEL